MAPGEGWPWSTFPAPPRGPRKKSGCTFTKGEILTWHGVKQRPPPPPPVAEGRMLLLLSSVQGARAYHVPSTTGNNSAPYIQNIVAEGRRLVYLPTGFTCHVATSTAAGTQPSKIGNKCLVSVSHFYCHHVGSIMSVCVCVSVKYT